MRRAVFALDLVSDAALIAEYERRHAPGSVWPRVVADLRQQGFQDLEIWRLDARLVMIATVARDYPRPQHPDTAAIVAAWESEMERYQRPIRETGPKWAEMSRIFDLGEHPAPSPLVPKRKLKRGGLELSEIGFGAAAVGNLYRPVSDDTARAALSAALDAGLNYFDTAPFYGFGLSERRVGDAVRGQGAVVSTKVGRLLTADPSVTSDAERSGFRSVMPFRPEFDYSRDAILKSWDASRSRTGLARIDILYVHDIGTLTHGVDNARLFEQLTTGGGFAALSELRDAGEIGAFGLGVNEWEICLEAMEHVDLDVVLLAGRYSLLEQGALSTFLPACLEREVGVVVGGPYNSGILATGTRMGTDIHYNYGPASAQIISHVKKIEAICDRFAVPLPAAALRFPLFHPAVVSVVPGMGTASRVTETLGLYGTEIPSEFWGMLRYEGLIDSDVPVDTYS